MKPFFCIDITEDKKNSKHNGDEFIVASVESHMTQALKKSTENVVEILKGTKLPWSIRAIRSVCGFVAWIIICVLIQIAFDKDSVSLAQAYSNVPWVFYTAGGCLLAWIALMLISSRTAKSVLEREETGKALSDMSSIVKSIYDALGVPPDAENVDVLTFKYKDKDGEIVPTGGAMDFTVYSAEPFMAYVEDGQIHFVNFENNYAFPFDEIATIHTVKKRIAIPEWGKDEGPKEGIYKQYKMTVDTHGCIWFKTYHILEINHLGESIGIYFPCYELPAFEKLTGLRKELP